MKPYGRRRGAIDLIGSRKPKAVEIVVKARERRLTLGDCMDTKSVRRPAITPKVFLGKTKSEAEKLAEELDFRFRIWRLDGRPLVVTRDRCLDRINVSINLGVVDEAHVG